MRVSSLSRRRIATITLMASIAVLAVTGCYANPADVAAPALRGFEVNGDGDVAPSDAAAASAAAAAQAWVATRPALLRAGLADEFVQHAPITSAGWTYVPYDRTHQGLPVVGGDFVVVIDPAGRVQTATVALQQPITALAIPAAATAQPTGRDGRRLVVYARSGPSRLAWESTNAADATTSYVDVATGAVLERRDGIEYGSLYSGRNGPSPLFIATKRVSFSIYNRYYLIDPSNNGVSCGDKAVGQPLMQTVDTWGNGDSSNKVTSCGDAMFAQQNEIKMLSTWLGRNGIDGAGHGFPMWVAPTVSGTAQWHSSGYADFTIGSTSLDTVGHEFGHAIDQYTPGGMSAWSTREFIGDVFGTATEWFASEPAGYDIPDWTILDREFWHSYPLGPYCYYDPGLDDPSKDPHAAGNIGDHWFYLLAEGTNPTDGQPISPTCNNTTLTGIGFRPALRILYNAMLMKTSDAKYPNYRQWTLRAAYNLYGCTNDFVNKVKAAWSALLVPPQLAEPLCGILPG
jgi:Zn-dependent metalloprotease